MIESEELEKGAEEYFRSVLSGEGKCECKRCIELKKMYESILRR